MLEYVMRFFLKYRDPNNEIANSETHRQDICVLLYICLQYWYTCVNSLNNDMSQWADIILADILGKCRINHL